MGVIMTALPSQNGQAYSPEVQPLSPDVCRQQDVDAAVPEVLSGALLGLMGSMVNDGQHGQ